MCGLKCDACPAAALTRHRTQTKQATRGAHLTRSEDSPDLIRRPLRDASRCVAMHWESIGILTATNPIRRFRQTRVRDQSAQAGARAAPSLQPMTKKLARVSLLPHLTTCQSVGPHLPSIVKLERALQSWVDSTPRSARWSLQSGPSQLPSAFPEDNSSRWVSASHRIAISSPRSGLSGPSYATRREGSPSETIATSWLNLSVHRGVLKITPRQRNNRHVLR